MAFTAIAILGKGFLQHIDADDAQQHKCHPVVDCFNGIRKQITQKEADQRHDCLKATEPDATGQACLQSCFLHCKTLADGDRERIHAHSHSQKQQLTKTHYSFLLCLFSQKRIKKDDTYPLHADKSRQLRRYQEKSSLLISRTKCADYSLIREYYSESLPPFQV